MSRAGIFIVSAKRTPFGTFGGKLKDFSATDLGDIACRAAIKSAAVDPERIDHLILGNVVQTCSDAPYIARHVGLRIGLPQHVPALVVNRLCGSGFQSIMCAAQEILTGDSQIVLAGGVESMSQSPYVVRNVRFGTFLGQKIEFEDMLWGGLTDEYIKTPMAITAENLGAQYNVTRDDSDHFALRSQTRWRLANNAGHFKAEIVGVPIKTRKGEEMFEVDEHPRETTIETLQKLKPVFKKDGLVTAGSASGICDGAAATVVASEAATKEHHLTPLARVVAWSAVGCDPHLMGFGPVPAIRNVLQATKMNLDQIDLVEVNEAFAPQAMAVQRELGLDPDKLNVSGGAVAVGHPLGASGTRITTHLIHELRRRGAKYGIGSACIGGGMGIAILIESVL